MKLTTHFKMQRLIRQQGNRVSTVRSTFKGKQLLRKLRL